MLLGHSSELLDSLEHLPAFHLCVSELLDSVLIGEGVLTSLQKALKSPLLRGTSMIPQHATVFGRLFYSKELFRRHRGPEDLAEVLEVPMKCLLKVKSNVC